MRIAVSALLSAWLATTGCGLGENSPTSPGPPAKDTLVRYAAVGASDVTGVGSSAPCYDFFNDCPGSPGYVFAASRSLRSQGYDVTVTNLGIPTATISRRFQDLGVQHGQTIVANFIDGEMRFVPRDATVVTIFAGGNDLNVVTSALGRGAGGGNPSAYIDLQVQNFRTDLTTLLAGIRERAGAARIIVLNLPNLGAMPYLAGATLAQRQAAQRLAVGMTTTAINPLASQGVRVVDLMCLAQLYLPASLSSDGFHPNDAGYALLAAEVVRAMMATTFAAPQASCPQMTRIPA